MVCDEVVFVVVNRGKVVGAVIVVGDGDGVVEDVHDDISSAVGNASNGGRVAVGGSCDDGVVIRGDDGGGGVFDVVGCDGVVILGGSGKVVVGGGDGHFRFNNFFLCWM